MSLGLCCCLCEYKRHSFTAPESEESRFSSGSGLRQQPRLASLPTEHSGLAPCIFPSKQPVHGITAWGHMSEPRASRINSVHHSHTEPQPAQSGDYTQSWLKDSVIPLTELSTVHHHQYPANCLGACGTDTDTLSIRTKEGDKNEEKREINPSKIGWLLC